MHYKDYLKEIKLHYPEVETILSKDPLDITRREMNHLYDLPLESFTDDENNLILRELGRQQGKNFDELAVDKTFNPFHYPKHTRMLDHILRFQFIRCGVGNTPPDGGYNQLQFARLRWLYIYSSDAVLDV